MKNPFKKKKKTNEKKKIDIQEILFYLPLLFSLVLCYFIYSKSDQILPCILFPLSAFSLSLLFRKEKKEKEKGLDDAILFYHRFLYFSSLEEDYSLGFSSAIHSLPISDLKDKLLDYQEQEVKENEIPLTVNKKQSEFALISFISLLLHNEEEYSTSTTSELKRKIALFEEDGKEKDEASSFVIPSLLLSLYVFLFLSMLF